MRIATEDYILSKLDIQGVRKKLYAVSVATVEELIDSIIPIFTQLHRSSCNLELETLF